LPNGTIIPCFPRLHLDTRSTPAALTAAQPARRAIRARPRAAASKEEVPAAAEPRTPPKAPASPPSNDCLTHMAWLDQRLEEELEQLTSEEAFEVLLTVT
jgi:hypothetical protein